MNGDPHERPTSDEASPSDASPPADETRDTSASTPGSGLDLSAFQMMPDWVSQLESGGDSPPAPSRFHDFADDDTDRRGRTKGMGGRRGDATGRGGFDRRGAGPGSPGGGRRDFREGGRRPDRPPGGRGEGRPGGGREGGRLPGRDRDRSGRRDRSHGGPRDRDREREIVEPIPGLQTAIRPRMEGAVALAQMIRRSGRTFSLLELANLVLAGRERYEIVFSPDPRTAKPDDKQGRALVRCRLDGSLWLDRDDAARHLMASPKLLSRYYRREEVAVDPPKGNFSGVAVCGFSGTVLGPPNHHSYQDALHRLHRERFAHMPIERYKSRIRIESSEEAVERWKAEQSRVEEFVFVPGGVPEPESSSTPSSPVAATQPPRTDDESPEAEAAADPPAPADPSVPAPEAASSEREDVQGAGADVADPDMATTRDAGSAAAAANESEIEAAAAAESDPLAPEADGELSGDEAAEDPGTGATDSASPAEGEIRLRGLVMLERHLRESLADELLEEVTEARVPGNIPGRLLSPALLAMLKSASDQARRSPAMVIAPLCDVLGAEGLRFFRRGGKRLYTGASKPRRMPPELQLSERIRTIVDFIRANPGAKVTRLLDAIAPENPASPPEDVASSAPPPSIPASESDLPPADAPGAAGDNQSSEAAPKPEGAAEQPAEARIEEASTAPPVESRPPPGDRRGQAQTRDRGRPRDKGGAEAPAPRPLTERQLAVLSDLRWLVGEGYVLEFSSSRLEMAADEPPPSSPPPSAPSDPKEPGVVTPPDTAKPSPPSHDTPAEPLEAERIPAATEPPAGAASPAPAAEAASNGPASPPPGVSSANTD